VDQRQNLRVLIEQLADHRKLGGVIVMNEGWRKFRRLLYNSPHRRSSCVLFGDSLLSREDTQKAPPIFHFYVLDSILTGFGSGTQYADLLVVKSNGLTWDSDLSFVGNIAAILLDLSGSAIGELASEVADQLLGAFVPPDPFVRIYIDGALMGETGSPEDVYEPVWESTIEIEIAEENSVTIQVLDEDINFDDPIGTLSIRGSTFLEQQDQGPFDLGPFDRVSSLVLSVRSF
jgi:hypothetical protein